MSASSTFSSGAHPGGQTAGAQKNIFSSFNLDRATVLKGIEKQMRGNQRVTTRTIPSRTSYDRAWRSYGVDLRRRRARASSTPGIGRDAEIRRAIRILSRKTKNNPGADRRTRRRQDRHRRGPGSSVSCGATCPRARRTRPCSRSTWACTGSPVARSTAVNLRSGSRPCSTRSSRPRAGSSSLSTSSTTSSARARRKVRWTQATCSSRCWPAANCIVSARPPSTNIARAHLKRIRRFEPRFQPILVEEPTVEDAISILRGLRERFELHHGVRIQDNALVSAAVLSHRYISDRFLPATRPSTWSMRPAR